MYDYEEFSKNVCERCGKFTYVEKDRIDCTINLCKRCQKQIRDEF